MSIIVLISILLSATGYLSGCKEQAPDPVPESPVQANSNPGPQNRVGQTNVAKTVATPTAAAAPTTKGQAQPKLPGSDQPLMDGEPILVHTLLWGADFNLRYCAGGEQTHQGSICAKFGINIRLAKGDDSSVQLADYRARRTPFMRNTIGTLGKNWMSLCTQDSGLCPMPHWMWSMSKGDYLVCRDTVKDIDGLLACKDANGKSRKCLIAAMKDGPWDKFLVNVIMEDPKHEDGTTGQWDQIEMLWTKNLSGEGSADWVFRNDPRKPDCAMTITPDMLALTGGNTQVGTGDEGSVKGAHVVTSTYDRRDGGIFDGLAVSTEFATKERQWIHAFIAAYETSSEQLQRLSRDYNSGRGSMEYEEAMAAMVAVYPTELKNNTEEANGLYLDFVPLGISGNVKFFDRTNDVGIAYHEKWAGITAKVLGNSDGNLSFGESPIDWNHAAFNNLASKNTKPLVFRGEATFAELEKMERQGTLSSNVLIRINAKFEVDDDEIADCTPYHKPIDSLIKSAKVYSNAAIAIRGFYDPTGLIIEIITAGKDKILRQEGEPGAYRYYLIAEQTEISLQSIEPWRQLLEDPLYKGAYDRKGNPFSTYVKQARDHSKARAESLKRCLIEYAQANNLQLDASRIHTEGVGVEESIVVKARSDKEMALNRRAELTLVKTEGGESVDPNDLDL